MRYATEPFSIILVYCLIEKPFHGTTWRLMKGSFNIYSFLGSLSVGLKGIWEPLLSSPYSSLWGLWKGNQAICLFTNHLLGILFFCLSTSFIFSKLPCYGTPIREMSHIDLVGVSVVSTKLFFMEQSKCVTKAQENLISTFDTHIPLFGSSNSTSTLT